MDVLSDILSALNLSSRLYYRSDLGAPWGLSLAATDALVFHVVNQGSCWLRADGEPQLIPLTQGEMIVLPHGEGHQLADDRATFTLPLRAVTHADSGCPKLQFGGDGPHTMMVCGGFYFAQGDGPPLRDLLPRVIHLYSHAGAAHDWLQPLLRQITIEAESDLPGAELVQRRLTDILFVQVLRAWIDEQAEGQPGWLAALRDPQVSLALGAIHRNPGAPWTVESLAKVAGLSRPVFAARFSLLVGQPPLHYVTAWRMQWAASAIRQERLSLSQIAARTGYVSEAAFSKAFKRWMGIGPRAYRRLVRQQRES